MRLFSKKEVSKEKIFRDEFIELQMGIISLCLEFADGNADYIYAYGSIEEFSTTFNVFFKKDGKVLTSEQINNNDDLGWQLLRLGAEDLQKIRILCEECSVEHPTEMKMYYNVKTKKYNADFKYEPVCTLENGVLEREVFENWIKEEKDKINMKN